MHDHLLDSWGASVRSPPGHPLQWLQQSWRDCWRRRRRARKPLSGVTRCRDGLLQPGQDHFAPSAHHDRVPREIFPLPMPSLTEPSRAGARASVRRRLRNFHVDQEVHFCARSLNGLYAGHGKVAFESIPEESSASFASAAQVEVCVVFARL